LSPRALRAEGGRAVEFLPLAFLALPFVLWGVLVWTRRARCRQTAERLRGRCIQQGAFETGAIVGDDFAVEPMKVGKSVRTTVRVAADGCPNDFVLRQGFFAASPCWSEARVHAATRQRMFLWEVALPGLAEPSEARQRELLLWLDPRVLDARFGEALAEAKVRELIVSDGFVGTRLSGVVLEPERLEHVIALLRRLGRPYAVAAPFARAHALARPA
jgi:hypothetical protein